MQREIENQEKRGNERRRDSKKDIKRGGAGINTQGDKAGIKRGDKESEIKGREIWSSVIFSRSLFFFWLCYFCSRVNTGSCAKYYTANITEHHYDFENSQFGCVCIRCLGSCVWLTCTGVTQTKRSTFTSLIVSRPVSFGEMWNKSCCQTCVFKSF